MPKYSVKFVPFEKGTLPAGFEPTRGDPIGFQVQRLNHSAKAAQLDLVNLKLYFKISLMSVVFIVYYSIKHHVISPNL